MAERIQLSRAKGWRMPANAVKVDRTTRWGNPYKVRGTVTAAEAVEAFRLMMHRTPSLVAKARAELAGKDLACWCRHDAVCHADVLLEIANGSAPLSPLRDEAAEVRVGLHELLADLKDAERSTQDDPEAVMILRGHQATVLKCLSLPAHVLRAVREKAATDA